MGQGRGLAPSSRPNRTFPPWSKTSKCGQTPILPNGVLTHFLLGSPSATESQPSPWDRNACFACKPPPLPASTAQHRLTLRPKLPLLRGHSRRLRETLFGEGRRLLVDCWESEKLVA